MEHAATGETEQVSSAGIPQIEAASQLDGKLSNGYAILLRTS